MILTYLRSSSISTFSFCQQKYFCSYVLGLKDKDNKKAIYGSVVHKNLELFALQRLAELNNKRSFTDDIFGRILFNKVSVEYFNDLSHAYYDNKHPGLMDKNSKDITLEWTHLAMTRVPEMDPRVQNVHTVEEFFEVEVPHEWADFSYTIGDQVISGRLGLKGTVDLIVKEDEKYFHIIDYKGLPVDTPIPTPYGWSTMGDLEVGDFVFDQYGTQTKVVAKSSQKIKECYEITFDDTSRVICDNEHYWKLSDNSVVQIKDLKIGDYINVARPIDCEEKELPIDPYTLGIWLGDGRNRGGEVSGGDSFIFEEIARRGFKVGINQEKRKVTCQVRTIFGLSKKLRANNLLHNKHIPEIYFRSSFNQRLDLLRGLMDSDGSANNTRQQCVFMNCREILSRDVKKLLLTLGQRAIVSNTIQKGFGLTVSAYPVSFRPIGIDPFLLPRKSEKIKRWGQGRSTSRRVKAVEKVDERLTQCISVDSPDHTYLCTENMIPTHNTGRRYDWGKDKIKEPEDFEHDPQLLLYYYALRLKYPERRFHVSIYYINDHIVEVYENGKRTKKMVEGGLYSFCFDDVHFARAEKMLKAEFDKIRQTMYPKLLSETCSHFKCRYMCNYSSIIPEISPDKPACLFLKDEIQRIGIDAVTAKYGDMKKMSVYEGGGRTGVELGKSDE
jgi:hypothetical protein